jgi:Alanine dehydrogenase/PNT, N-terminal domain
MTVAVDAFKETPPGETRVAVTPASVQRLRASGIDVVVERDAGAGVLLPARTYTDVGARVVDAEQLVRRADAVLAIHAPDAPRRAQLRGGQLLWGLLQACTTIELVAALDDAGVIAVSLGHAALHAQQRPVDGYTHLAGKRRRVEGERRDQHPPRASVARRSRACRSRRRRARCGLAAADRTRCRRDDRVHDRHVGLRVRAVPRSAPTGVTPA